jgi:formate hydrogenlyase subunit 3/multisubunit Na+/H+ antiporter MnhD subunit
MNRFSFVLTVILIVLIILHLVYSIDYEHLYTTDNKAGATGVMISILGLVAIWLANRSGKGETDVSG